MLAAVLLPVLGHAAAAPAPAQEPVPTPEPAPLIAPELGGPAPAHGLATFATDPATERTRTSDGSMDFPLNGGHEHHADLGDLDGYVVLLHVFDPLSDAARTRSLPLVRDLMTANADRFLAAVSLVPPQPDAEGLRESLAIPWPVAVWDDESRSPYLMAGLPREDRVWLVDRCGRIAWAGSPAEQEDELLEAVAEALAAPAAPPLTRRLAPELGRAVSAYTSGEWQEARELAEKAAKRADDDPQLAADARLVAELVAAQLDALHRRYEQASGRNRILALMRLQAAVERGFPDCDLRERIDEDLQERSRRMGAGTVDDAETMMELLEDRPVLFPARRSRAGDRMAKDLETFVKRSNNDIEPTRLARWLLARYARAHDAD